MKDGRRVVGRAAVVGLGLAGLVLTVPTFAAAPDKPPPAGKKAGENAGPPKAEARPNAKLGKAKCCLLQLEGPAGSVTAGGAPARFDLVVSRFDKGCAKTRRTITVRLEGLATEHIRLERVVSGQVFALRDRPSGADTVEAVDALDDPKLICGKDAELTASYRIAFLDDAPSGPAELVVSAHAPNGKLLDSARATTAVVEGMAATAPPPQTTPPATEGPVEETSAPPPVQQEPVPPQTPAEVPVAPPPLARTAESSPISTTLLTASLVFAFAAILLLTVLWRLRRMRSGVPAADEAPTASLPTGVGAELAKLTGSDGAAGSTKPTAP